ncbi:MAG TPA: chloride channel protein [Planctomycetota bacterium]|nr:chloride channel protein [Planctomycetota bacterium]
MFAKIRQAILTHLIQRVPPEKAFLILIPTIGVLTGFSALGIAYLIGLLQSSWWGSHDSLLLGAEAAPWWQRLMVPTLGGLALGLFALLLKRDVRGAGTPGLVQSLALRGGSISFRQELPAVAAGIVTVSTGGSLGREGPMIEFAAALGSRLGRLFSLNTQQVRVLVCCSAAAAISAVYNAPIGGTVFVMEILIGSFAVEIFGPVVIASVISTLIFRAAMGNLPRFVIPAYELVSAWELSGYLVLGVVCGLFSALTIRAMGWVDDGFKKLRGAGFLLPALGFALVGGVGIVLPHVFGNGAETVNMALHDQLPLYLLIALPIVKLLTTAITRSSGGSGGIFTPTLMMGALVGGAFGYGVHLWFPMQTAEYGAYALVGMGAVLAGTTNAPIMAILMIFEQTNSYSIILPLMMVCIVSNFVARWIQPLSLHLESLRRRGVTLPSGPEASVMKSLRVADVMHDDVEAVTKRDPYTKVVAYFLRTPRNFLYVVDDERRFVGAISVHKIKGLLSEGQALDVVIAADLVEPFEVVTPHDFLADAMEKFWRQHSERLPVVEDQTGRKLIAWVSQHDLIGVYSQEILRKPNLMARFTSLGGAKQGRGSFVELPEGFSLQTFIVPETLDGRTIGELAPRAAYGIHVIQIMHFDSMHRRQTVEMPVPASVLHTHDRLVVIGSKESVTKMQEALNVEVEESEQGDAVAPGR